MENENQEQVIPVEPQKTVELTHGNIQVIQVQLLNQLVQNTNKIISLLEKKE